MPVLSTGAFAQCGHAVAMLEQQVRLIGEAAPLMRDRNAALQEGSSVSHTIDKELRDRTRLMGGGFDGGTARPPEPAAHEASMKEAREAISRAREALQRGEEAACQQAVSDGLNAARRARATL